MCSADRIPLNFIEIYPQTRWMFAIGKIEQKFGEKSENAIQMLSMFNHSITIVSSIAIVSIDGIGLKQLLVSFI